MVKLFLETDSDDFSLLLNELGILFIHVGGKKNLEEARLYLEKALSSGIRNFGKDFPNTALGMVNLGAVLTDIGNQKNIREARNFWKVQKKIYLKHFGEYFYMVGNSQSWIDLVDEKLDEMENE